ncbi:helix-turn-helix transcriptional regulator [Staphylococcus pseudintermedius]|nr:helix-turn-helix transcriptional regulator [Staphylococcus pseudintermedius]EHT7951065.1 helix-turn-helix transcriptional regulator [Staphylococcus pseudintermedius]EIQ4001351.1 helix-turn-helix transcriptional regulator [Staphylococcus pseudintermedius]EJE1166698.1 helix-turn-helix transcriptional regulator [Staphylococcus pseudintermedius]EJG5860346.1 helix-turn-helix transcriptional regulator [Staphylococcus pseudintermedius]
MNKVIAANIRCFRKHKKLSQKELADRLGTTRQHICDIERCKKNVSIAMLGKIAKKLQVEPYQLLK